MHTHITMKNFSQVNLNSNFTAPSGSLQWGSWHHTLRLSFPNRPHSIIISIFKHGSEAFGSKLQIFQVSFVLLCNSQKRLRYKENNTKYRSLTRKPRSHVRILIHVWFVWIVFTWRHQFLKSKTKDPPKLLSSSGKEGGIFISVYNLLALVRNRAFWMSDVCVTQ